MTKKYRLTPQADADLEDIFIYTLQKWDLAQAENYLGTLDRYMTKLAKGTLQGRSCAKLFLRTNHKEKAIDGLQYYHAERHYIIYIHTETGIDVLTLYHDQMDIEKRLKDLGEER